MKDAATATSKYFASGEVENVPAYEPGNDRAGMFFELDYYANPRRGAVPPWNNEMAEMSWAFWLTFDGLRSAAEVTAPTVLVHGDGCVLPENARAVYAALRGPKRLEWADGSQIDFYDQPAQVRNAVAIIDSHFQDTLKAV